MARPRAPEGLGPAGKRLWLAVNAELDLAAHETELLRQICAVADLIAGASAILADEGLIAAGSKGQPVPHPMVWVLADQRRLMAQLFRAMGAEMPDEVIP